ncbi:PREDICTED: pro-cathepsin H-like [Priapulus caudatus]|uniref:Pro-cathepsin H-like n=1 Tax=Priapulus caudatus TaxID=37621 RepID=A0ABM1E6N8_PRICU|nr:PREDICTED: pro-cathepsin H-like [Priapulus caudatus]
MTELVQVGEGPTRRKRQTSSCVPAWDPECIPLVKDQGDCGCCYAFAMTGAIEASVCLAQGALPALSEQLIVDCCERFHTSGCQGGSVYDAFSCIFAMKYMAYDWNYQYTAEQGECIKTYGYYVPLYRSDPFYYDNTRGDGETVLQDFVCYAPTIIGLALSTESSNFFMYGGGVLDDVGVCGSTMNHVVVIVGVGEEAGVPYWLAINSWGTDWGEDGFVKLKKNSNLCGIGNYTILPPIKH